MTWTRTEFMAQLRAAGWKRQPGAAAVYEHPDGAVIDIDKFNKYQGGVVWVQYAEREQLPATSEPPF